MRFKGELEHRIVKLRYARTDRRRFVSQLVKMHEELLESWAADEHTACPSATGNAEVAEEWRLEEPYKIAADESNAIWLTTRSWLREDRQRSNPAFEVGAVHILSRSYSNHQRRISSSN